MQAVDGRLLCLCTLQRPDESVLQEARRPCTAPLQGECYMQRAAQPPLLNHAT
jgi:hypothetical protein